MVANERGFDGVPVSKNDFLLIFSADRLLSLIENVGTAVGVRMTAVKQLAAHVNGLYSLGHDDISTIISPIINKVSFGDLFLLTA